MSTRRGVLQYALLLAAPGGLSACGFQIRGTVPLPADMATVFIEANDRFTPLYRSLRRGLEDNGAEVVGERAQANAVVHILGDETGERVLSVSGRNIPREFEVFYIVDFALSIDGTQRLASQRLTRTRSYTWDETQVLGKAEEGRRMQRALADDLVIGMLRQFSSAA